MADPYGLNQPLVFEPGKVVPRDQVGVDYMIISPFNDTSKRNLVDSQGRTKSVQLPYKNLNTVDITTANLSDFKFVGVSTIAYMAIRQQRVTDYFSTLASRHKRIRYDFSNAQAQWTDYIHTFCSLTKSAKPRGGMLMNAIRTKFERVESTSVEDIRNAKEGNKPGQQQQQQGNGWK